MSVRFRVPGAPPRRLLSTWCLWMIACVLRLLEDRRLCCRSDIELGRKRNSTIRDTGENGGGETRRSRFS